MDLLVDPGTLLAASPEMLDPNFMHAVVLICQHTPEGAYGLVVNRPSTYGTKGILSDDLDLGRADVPVYLGGPVGPEKLQSLHRVPERISGGVEIAPGLWIGGEIQDIGKLALAEPQTFPRSALLFIGYSGWGAGQLEMELATGSWLPAPGLSERIFRDDPANLWREVVRSLGEGARGLDAQPPDPTWN